MHRKKQKKIDSTKTNWESRHIYTLVFSLNVKKNRQNVRNLPQKELRIFSLFFDLFMLNIYEG